VASERDVDPAIKVAKEVATVEDDTQVVQAHLQAEAHAKAHDEPVDSDGRGFSAMEVEQGVQQG
jgi:hypothetical protein